MKLCPQCESGYHDSFTTCPIHGGMLSEIRDLRPGMLIRDTYRIKAKLGKGGMGSVYLAQHTLLDEPRALKFLSADLGEDENFTGRFLREVRTLRLVRNKNVVDCGDPERAEDGSLFFSMEYVDGPNLRDFLKASPRFMDVPLALSIARGIAEGLGGAHAKGLVHRDIKPENILLAKEGDSWVPKIADFGIVATKENSLQTQAGSSMLTMAYAAPEQWIGIRAADLDGRTDLYALGGVLYEMLTRRCAFDAENYHGWAQMHLNKPPIAPSSLRPELNKWRGLDALVLRLLAKDRNDRPKDVAELLTLIDAVVYDPSPAPKAPAAWAPTRVYSQSSPPPTPPQEAETSLPVPAAQPPAPPPAEIPPPAPAPSPASRPASEDHTTFTPVLPSPPDTTDSGSYQTIKWPDSAPSAGHLRGVRAAKRGSSVWPWIVMLALAVAGVFAAQRFYQHKPNFRSLNHQLDSVLSVAFSPNGLTLAAASKDKTIQIWDVTEDKPLNTILDSADAVAFSPDGKYMASAGLDKSVRLWDVSAGTVIATMDGHADEVLSVAFSPDSKTLASGSRDKTIRLWDVDADKAMHTLLDHTGDVRSVAFSPDGRTLASASADATIKIWDLAGIKPVVTLQGHTGAVNSVAFSPDSKTLASAGSDMTIKLWDVATARLIRTLQGHTAAVNSVAISADGRQLASAGADSTVRLWDIAAGQTVGTFRGHTGAVNSVAFSSDRHTLASGGADTSVKLWDLSAAHN